MSFQELKKSRNGRREEYWNKKVCVGRDKVIILKLYLRSTWNLFHINFFENCICTDIYIYIFLSSHPKCDVVNIKIIWRRFQVSRRVRLHTITLYCLWWDKHLGILVSCGFLGPMPNRYHRTICPPTRPDFWLAAIGRNQAFWNKTLLVHSVCKAAGVKAEALEVIRKGCQ